MKNSIFILAAVLLLTNISCTKEDTTADVSRTTFFVDLELQGEPTVLLKQNENYSDPGAEAFENGAPVPVDVQGTIDSGTPEFYNIAYSATNSDGFASSVNRTVVVYEPAAVTGVYDGLRVGRTGGLILIKSAGDNMYEISDLLGGYYHQAQGFGIAFAAPAIIKVEGDKLTTDGGICGFGPVVIKDAFVSADQRFWSWTITLTDFDFSFDVTIDKLTE